MRWSLCRKRFVVASALACLWLFAIDRFLWRPMKTAIMIHDQYHSESRKADKLSNSQPSTHGSKFDEIQHCSRSNGMLLIEQGDEEGAAGTIFYLFILNQLQYAERYGLIPFIHLNNVSRWVFYKNEGEEVVGNRTFSMISGVVSSVDEQPQADNQRYQSHCPGRPKKFSPTNRQTFELFPGNGVWSTYFEPVNSFHPINNNPCRDLPLFRLSPAQILHGLHLQCPWSIRAWQYGGMAKNLLQDDAPKRINDWLHPQRLRAAQLVKRYYRPLPWIQEAASRANPSKHCLAMHVRHSDKGNRRRRIKLQAFLPHVEAYLQSAPSDATIYLATDSTLVYSRIQELWPVSIASKVILQTDVLRSSNNSAVFQLVANHNQHLTNAQVLTDVLAMAKCQVLLHGLSAVSEAALYHNVDMLSVNLEEMPYHQMFVEDFVQKWRGFSV